jgi:carbon storage regulator
MLVLSRRSNESIVINGNITVTVLEIRGDHVRIGIDAPREITIHREEIHAELARANKEASAAATSDIAKLPRPPRPS